MNFENEVSTVKSRKFDCKVKFFVKMGSFVLPLAMLVSICCIIMTVLYYQVNLNYEIGFMNGSEKMTKREREIKKLQTQLNLLTPKEVRLVMKTYKRKQHVKEIVSRLEADVIDEIKSAF